MNIYQQAILDNYRNPQNSGKPDEFTHSAKFENTSCGDEITIYLKVDKDVVTGVHYEAQGCSISIASASMLSEELKGKTVSEINELDLNSVLDLLGIELTPTRLKCATLPLEAVKEAIGSD